jgi:S1-C subfamily serine protease
VAVAVTEGHLVASTAAAVGTQTSILVQLPTGGTVTGTVVSVNASSGIAVLSIPDGTATTPIAPSTAPIPNTGATVLNPAPAPARVFRDDRGTQIAVDASVPVVEGSLVVDTDNHLIGMCTQTSSGVRILEAQDLLNAVRGVLAEAAKGWLGLHTTDTLQVDRLTADGPAALAGIAVGDVFAAVDGTPIANRDTLRSAVEAHAPGDVVVFSIVKAGTTTPVDVTITLGQNPGPM